MLLNLLACMVTSLLVFIASSPVHFLIPDDQYRLHHLWSLAQVIGCAYVAFRHFRFLRNRDRQRRNAPRTIDPE